MFARHLETSFRVQKQGQFGGRKRGLKWFPLRAANQVGAVLGPVLGSHFGLRFGGPILLNLGLEFQTSSQAAWGQKERSKFVSARFHQTFP